MDPVEHYTRFLHKNPPPGLGTETGESEKCLPVERERRQEGAPRLSIERDDDDDDELID